MSRNRLQQGFIVACASHQRKIAMAAQLNSFFGESSFYKTLISFVLFRGIYYIPPETII